MSKLDHSRPVGDIFGTYDLKPLARYTQDGKFYDAKGNLLLSEEEKAIEAARLQEELAALAPAPVAPVVPPVVQSVIDAKPVEAPAVEDAPVVEDKPAGKKAPALPKLPD